MMARRWLWALCMTLLLVACGGKDKGADAPRAAGAADDPLALLPAGAVAVGSLDARAFYASQSVGAELARMVEQLVPVGQDAGFSASRDIERVVVGVYATQGVDGVAVLVGRLDEAKIRAAAEKQALVQGAAVVATPYADKTIYTHANVGFAVLSSSRAVVGTETAIRRVLDRVRAGAVKRELPEWMAGTLESRGAACAIAFDATQPGGPELLRQAALPFLHSLQRGRLLATFQPPGLQVAGSFTYPTPAQAQTAAEQTRQAAGLAPLLAMLGLPQLRDMNVRTEQSDVQVQLSVDDQSLRQLVVNLPRWLGRQ